eukprot:CAMPEP_0184494550 /NCGR_PEP_ID=MMETSP0113_2-20130426/29017_1 /TAXON_ID=91329 /ORGANISM="Norrisiella sphaerica, Strain BC52" /LENGTH=96 /DNA_ID=CAMNT_0026880355 /DNA_START=233 /DNA_END=523 /DNA_ORIENTATION=+
MGSLVQDQVAVLALSEGRDTSEAPQTEGLGSEKSKLGSEKSNETSTLSKNAMKKKLRMERALKAKLAKAQARAQNLSHQSHDKDEFSDPTKYFEAR